MQRTLLSMLLAVSVAGVVGADDIMMTGPKADKIKQEIINLDKEKAKDQLIGPPMGDFIDRHEVDSILYLGGGLSENVTKTQRANEWRSGVRKGNVVNHHDYRVRVYDNGNVAVMDFLTDFAPRINGKDVKQFSTHVLEVYVKHNGAWRTVVHDVFVTPPAKEKVE